MAKVSPLMFLPPLIFAAFVAVAAIGMLRDDPDALPSVREGQPAPAVAITEFPGKTPFSDADLRDGEVKLVNFWASWCAPCRVEHPNLAALSEEGITIYGVNMKDDQDKADAFLGELGDPFAALGRDEAGRMGFNWGVYGLPETFVIAGDGTIMLRFAGPLTQRAIEERLRPALAEAAARGN
ncbi:MAG: DsbE family thiol:disulfide interchange protein [Rhodobacteraceae bacterium]|nr:DsbE family thiol:disulfide interchange protein [Paracoccaceae bacterium]